MHVTVDIFRRSHGEHFLDGFPEAVEIVLDNSWNEKCIVTLNRDGKVNPFSNQALTNSTTDIVIVFIVNFG